MANSLLSADAELSFLVDACAPTVRTPAIEQLDWTRVVLLARKHRVYPRVWAKHGELFPAEHAVILRTLAAENSILALRNVARTIEVVRLLRDARIDSLVLKGPLLAHDLYGDVALRVIGDIDLLVREEQLLPAARLLAQTGFRHTGPITAAALATIRRTQHDVSFAHPDDDTLIELHADIAQPHYGFHVDLEGWWSRRRERALGGDTVWSLGLEDTYLLSALHAAKHRWHRLDLVADVAAFGQLGIDRASVHHEAAKAWLLRHVRTGEAIAAWMFDGKPDNSTAVSGAISQLIAGKDFGRWTGMAFDLRLRERLPDKASYLWRRLLSAKAEL